VIVLRPIHIKDLSSLEQFAKIPGMFSLPNERVKLKKLIERSNRSFAREHTRPEEDKFIFVAEDFETHEVRGTSMVTAKHGTETEPHFYFQVGNEEKYSQTINTGFIHGTLELKADTDGPTELGGLVIDADFRKSEKKYGRNISFVRFLFVALHREYFQNQMIAELLPPLNQEGQSPLWEAIGRRFTNMNYWEADALCQKNKEFILSLFPTGKIYTSFLAPDARDSIGKVGPETKGAFHLLTQIGFEYNGQVDPFDGGPHLWANIDDISLFKKIKKVEIKAKEISKGTMGILHLSQHKEFLAVSVTGELTEDQLCLDLKTVKSIEKLIGEELKIGTWMPTL
tara:strand:- start:81 stop:1103 length:1023 start_codon:yes stop_codon:yes gene_type:complete